MPIVNPTPAAAGAVTGQEQFSGNAVTIANGDSAEMTFDNPSGDALVDLTNPAEPAIINAGVYAICGSILPGGNLTAGGLYSVTIGWGDNTVIFTSPAAVAAKLNPVAAISATAKIPAGRAVSIVVANLDGVASRDFSMFLASITRIS